MDKKRIFSQFIDKVVSWPVEMIYSKEKKSARIIILLMIVGFILRLIAALHEGFLADDMVYASQSAGILSSKILSTHSNPPLFFYLTDLAYKLLGYTTLASRIFPLIAGVMLIPLVFLVCRRLFNEKIALFSAFFVAFSTFLIKMTFTEQSLVVLFFSFVGVYFGINYLDNRKIQWLILSGVGFGLGLLTKYSAPFFIISFLIFSGFYVKSRKEQLFSKKNVQHLSVFFLILVMFALPFITFNYFIYEDKGIVDVYFSRIIKVDKAQEIYGGLAGQERSFFQNLVLFSNYGNYNLLYKTDILILLFGIAGFVFLFKNKDKRLWFLLIFIIVPFILQSAGAPLQKHFTFLPFLFAIPAGYSLSKLFEKMSGKMKVGILIIMVLFMILSLGYQYGTPSNYLTPSATSSLKSFINSEVNDKDLLVFDNRIYTSTIFWLATDKPFLILSQFPQVYQFDQNITQGYREITKVYFVECIPQDCGWGWVANDQNLNMTSQNLLQSVKQNAKLVKEIPEINYKGNEFFGEKEKMNEYAVYEVEMYLHQSVVQQTKQIQTFYLVPYLYKNMNNYLYNYQVSGIGSVINSLSLAIIYLAMFLTFILFLIILLLI